MRINLDETAFCLVDVQERLFPHMYNKVALEKNLNILLKGLKVLEVPFIINEQYKKGIGETISSLQSIIKDDEHFEKTTFSCCKNPTTLEAVKKLNKKNIIVAGIETHVCVLQTCIDLLHEGFRPILIVDCVGSRTELNTQIALRRLEQAGVILSTYESILFELTVNAKNPVFKEISSLVK